LNVPSSPRFTARLTVSSYLRRFGLDAEYMAAPQ